MIHIHAGTDTYGRVKAVAGTAIVTKFAMFQFLPIFPIRSFYFVGKGPTTKAGVPFLASTQTTSIAGLPLASVDLTSVVMAYLRGLFGALAIIGCMAMVPGIMELTGEHLDEFAMMMTIGLVVSLVVGVLGGSLTYAVPLTSRRDRDIRQFRAELLGISADPARVTPDAKALIRSWLDAAGSASDAARTRTIRRLIEVRLGLPDPENGRALEDRTDDLLEQLRVAPVTI